MSEDLFRLFYLSVSHNISITPFFISSLLSILDNTRLTSLKSVSQVHSGKTLHCELFSGLPCSRGRNTYRPPSHKFRLPYPPRFRNTSSFLRLHQPYRTRPPYHHLLLQFLHIPQSRTSREPRRPWIKPKLRPNLPSYNSPKLFSSLC